MIISFAGALLNEDNTAFEENPQSRRSLTLGESLQQANQETLNQRK
jgi:hypothetical protein